VTHGALRLEIPVLQPDEAFVRRLAELAAGSTPSSGVVVPVSFGGPTGRALAAAAAVAAITAGAAAAASQITHSHDSPAPPITTRGTQVPTSPSTSGQTDAERTDPPLSGHDPATQAVAADTAAQDPQAVHSARTQDSSESGPGTSDPDETTEPGDAEGPSDEATDQSGPGDGSTASGSDGGSDGGSDSGSDGASDGSTSGGDSGSGSGDGGSGTSSDEGTSGSGGPDDGTTASPGSESSRLLAGSGD
jgi:hypothetical protein